MNGFCCIPRYLPTFNCDQITIWEYNIANDCDLFKFEMTTII